MTHPLRALSRASLHVLAQALDAGVVDWPPRSVQLGRLALEGSPDGVRGALEALGSAACASSVLRLLAEERGAAQAEKDRLELVWSGPEHAASRTRETSVVVRELFSRAERSVLVATFAIAQGEQLFATLQRRMSEVPSLSVTLCLNLPRLPGDARDESVLLDEHAQRLRRIWPGPEKPAVFFDPRALGHSAGPRFSLHAKCVVVDDRWSFVTSANFTEAAQQRNIEVGVLADDPALARSLAGQFGGLIAGGGLRPLTL